MVSPAECPLPIRVDGECWIFTGAVGSSGYGVVKRERRMWLAHRYVFTKLVGPIAPGFEIDHVRDRGCRSKLCVRPDHLEAVSHAENVRRGRSAALNRLQVVEIREATASDRSRANVRDVAERFDVHPSTVSRIASGSRWAA